MALGAVGAVVSLTAFTQILWNLSGPLQLGSVELPRAMVMLVYVYVIAATLLAFKVGRPLIRLNFLAEQLTANFRYALVRLRENAENIAFYQGAAAERRTLGARFAAYIGNLWALILDGQGGWRLGLQAGTACSATPGDEAERVPGNGAQVCG